MILVIESSINSFLLMFCFCSYFSSTFLQFIWVSDSISVYFPTPFHLFKFLDVENQTTKCIVFLLLYLMAGGYDKEEKAARAYDLAALKYWGTSTTTNFPVS